MSDNSFCGLQVKYRIYIYDILNFYILLKKSNSYDDVTLSLRDLEKYCVKKDDGMIRYDNGIFSLQKKIHRHNEESEET